ncbi:MAG: hypothetical protein K0S31_2219 [Sphingobacterium multivorum]|jgi:hypothetical protein|nr:hypothetical protein [Sphingobacterium multivorum]
MLFLVYKCYNSCRRIPYSNEYELYNLINNIKL